MVVISSKFKLQQNWSILRSSIKFITKSERFSGFILQRNVVYASIFICSFNFKYEFKLLYHIRISKVYIWV